MANKTLRELIEEVESLLEKLREIEDETEDAEHQYFVASYKRNKFHRLSCDYASYIMQSRGFWEFYSHEEAVEAGFKPCGNCRA